MKKSYDIILYFGWVHSSSMHKYFALKEELNKKVNTLLVIGNTNYGMSEKQFSLFKDFSEDVVLADTARAREIFFHYKPKVLVLGGVKWEHSWQSEISANLGSTTIQLPHGVFGEVWIKCNPEYLAMLGPIHELFIEHHKPEFKNVKKIKINPWLHGLCERCLPTKLSRQDFCEKYNLNPNKDIFIWLPDMLLVSGGENLNPRYGVTKKELLNIYKEVCNLGNTIIKLHPNEYKRHKAQAINNKWSYELAEVSAPVLDPIDSHWAYKYAACGIAHASAVGVVFGYFATPFVHIGTGAASNWDPEWVINGQTYYSWVGHECGTDEITNFFKNKKYEISDKKLYQDHKDKFCFDAKVDPIEYLAEKILSFNT